MLRDLCVFQKAECKSIRQFLCHHEYLRFAGALTAAKMSVCLHACFSLSLSLSLRLPSLCLCKGRARTGAMEVDVLVQAWIAVHMAGGISGAGFVRILLHNGHPLTRACVQSPQGVDKEESECSVLQRSLRICCRAREAQAPMLSSSLLSSGTHGRRRGSGTLAFRYLDRAGGGGTGAPGVAASRYSTSRRA